MQRQQTIGQKSVAVVVKQDIRDDTDGHKDQDIKRSQEAQNNVGLTPPTWDTKTVRAKHQINK